MLNAATFLDVLEELRRVAFEWMGTNDSMIKEPVFTKREQIHNDQTLDRLRSMIKRFISSKHLHNYKKSLKNYGLKGRTCRVFATIFVWVFLKTWSNIFLSKQRNPQHLSESRQWLGFAMKFENTMRRFMAWQRKVYPTCSKLEELKACRIMFIALVLDGVGDGREENIREPLFAFSLLYPLVDDYFDTQTNNGSRGEFSENLKLLIKSEIPLSGAFSSPHPKSKLIGELTELIKQAVPKSSTNHQCMVDILLYILELEFEQTPKDILFATGAKGGLSVCMIHVLLGNVLYKKDLSPLLKIGLSLQMVDDIQDLEEDLMEHTTTLATSYAFNSDGLRHHYARTINFIRRSSFRDVSNLKSLVFIDGIRVVLRESMIMLVMESAARSNVLKQSDRLLILQHSPISMDFLRIHPIEQSLYKLLILFQ